MARGLRASMKYADKIGAQYTIVLGDDEISSGVASVKNMQSGNESNVKFEDLYEFLK